jgi:hypothetical protein
MEILLWTLASDYVFRCEFTHSYIAQFDL